MPGKHLVVQAVMKTHLSQLIGVGAFDGQQGVSIAISSAVADMDISSAVADMDISSAIAGIDASEAVPAMTGEASGANTSPAIMTIASSRRMVI
jgi:hypothetical protein